MAALLLAACRPQAPVTTPAPDTSAPPTPIKVGYLPVSTSLPNWLAMSEGFTKQRGLAVTMERFANADLMLVALYNGDIQATSVCADEPILAAAARGQDSVRIYLQEILTLDRTFDAIIVKKNSPIQKIKDLEGRSIACFPGSQLREYLKLIFESAGVDGTKVKVVELPPPNMLPSLTAGTVDACFALEPTITIAVEKGLGRIIEASPIARHIGKGQPICAASYCLSTAWAKAQPAAAQAYVEAVYEALDFIERDYPKAAALYPSFTPIPPELAGKVVITKFAKADAPDLAGLRREIEVLTAAGTIQGAFDPERLIYRGGK